MKVRFHGQVEWHVPTSDEAGRDPATLCGVSLSNANTFSYTFKKIPEGEMCARCGALGGKDDSDPRISMDRS